MHPKSKNMLALSAAVFAVAVFPTVAQADHRDELVRHIKKMEKVSSSMHNSYRDDLRHSRMVCSNERALLEAFCDLRDETYRLGKDMRCSTPVYHFTDRFDRLSRDWNKVEYLSRRVNLSSCVRTSLRDYDDTYDCFRNDFRSELSYSQRYYQKSKEYDQHRDHNSRPNVQVRVEIPRARPVGHHSDTEAFIERLRRLQRLRD